MDHKEVDKRYKELLESGVDQYEAALRAIGVDPELAREGAETIKRNIKEA